MSLLDRMRGPWLKTPLLFLLVLFSSLTGTGFCEDEVDSPTPEEQEEKPPTPEDSNGDTSDPGDTTMTTSSYSVFTIMTNSSDLETGGSGSGDGEITSPVGPINSIDSDEGLGTTEILIPVVVAVVIIGVVAFVIYILYRRRKQEKNQELNKEDPYLEECSTEKVPMPMFEDDVPSVQELEIDELNQLTKKDL